MVAAVEENHGETPRHAVALRKGPGNPAAAAARATSDKQTVSDFRTHANPGKPNDPVSPDFRPGLLVKRASGPDGRVSTSGRRPAKRKWQDAMFRVKKPPGDSAWKYCPACHANPGSASLIQSYLSEIVRASGRRI